jgi:uncharacterized repeat protein (TIGR03803 family)
LVSDQFRLANRDVAYHLVYSFGSADHNGVTPYASLLDVNGTLYGTTAAGGTGSACKMGCGTIFSLSKAGQEHVLYSFGSYAHDGVSPYAGLIGVGGTFYGTTRDGGSSSACSSGCGAVFSVDTAGKERVLYSFGSYTHDGTHPNTGLIDVGGTFYGTTQTGGARGHGSVFSVDTAGKERVLFSLGTYKHDGLSPAASLIITNGMLYGTTQTGGVYNDGTVFTATTAGKERIMHSFGKGSDGKEPQAALTFADGSFYGTTAAGGTSNEGTVFIMNTAGSEGALHSFGIGADGKSPQDAVTSINGTLYGATERGGSHSYGTLFSVNGTTGAEQVLYSFDGTQGAYPYAGLIDVGGILYGTTPYGGSGSGCTIAKLKGCGTVFDLSL